MGKVHLDRLKRRYDVTTDDYFDIVQKIIGQGSLDVARQVGQIERAKWLSAGGPDINMPDLEQIIGSDAIYTRKSAINGLAITDSLRDKLTEKLGQVLSSGDLYMPDGTVNPDIIDAFRDSIIDVFEGYAHRTGGEVPSNVQTIANTEVETTMSEIKNAYAEEFIFQNPDAEVSKVWVHRPHMSKNPRENHAMVHGQKKLLEERFEVPVLDKDGNRVGTVWMDHPHDPDAPPEEVINCRCTVKYTVRRNVI